MSAVEAGLLRERFFLDPYDSLIFFRFFRREKCSTGYAPVEIFLLSQTVKQAHDNDRTRLDPFLNINKLTKKIML